jgi:hypothetical protein
VDVLGVAGTERAWLHQTACTRSACDAARVTDGVGGQLRARLGGVVGAYAGASAVRISVDAARFNEPGLGIEGGLLGTLPLGDRVGLDGWLGLQHEATGDLGAGNNHGARTALDVGLVVHLGDADDQLLGWIGVGGEPYSADRLTVLGGSLSFDLSPPVPVEARAGAAFVSLPLGGAWTRRGRLLAGVDASAGYRSSLSAWLGVAL